MSNNDKVYEKEDIIDQMRALKDYRDDQIYEKIREGETGLKPKYNGKFVTTVKYLGKIDWKEEIEGQSIESKKDIFLLIEEVNGRVIKKYFTENNDLLAVETERLGFVPEKNDLDKKRLKEKIIELNKKGILDLNEEEDKRKEKIAEVLGVNIEDLESIDEIDLEQELRLKQEENVREDKQGKKKDEKDKKEQVIEKEEAQKLNAKEETSLNQNIKGETLGNKLGLEETGITDARTLVRVATKTNANALGVRLGNGQIVLLGENILKPDSRSGVNSSESSVTINNNGRVEKEVNSFRYEIVNGNKKEYITIGNDESSGKEIKYSMWSNEKGEYVDVELNTQKTLPQNNYVHQFMKDKSVGTKEATEVLNRYDTHKYCEEKSVEDVDNDNKNDTHTNDHDEQHNEHFELSEEYLAKITSECLEDPTVNKVFTKREVEGFVKDGMEAAIYDNKYYMTTEQLAQRVKQEIVYDAEMMEGRQKSEHKKG